MRCSLPVYILAVLGAYGACWPRAAATQAGDRPDEWAPWWTSVEELERAVAADPGLVGRRYRRGSTVLHVAAERGDAAVVRWLLRRSEEHTSELQSPCNIVCRLLLEKKKTKSS